MSMLYVVAIIANFRNPLLRNLVLVMLAIDVVTYRHLPDTRFSLMVIGAAWTICGLLVWQAFCDDMKRHSIGAAYGILASSAIMLTAIEFGLRTIDTVIVINYDEAMACFAAMEAILMIGASDAAIGFAGYVSGFFHSAAVRLLDVGNH